MRLPWALRRRSKRGTALALTADALLVGLGVYYWNSDNAPAGEFLVFFGGFLLVGEILMLTSVHGHLPLVGTGWGAIFLIGLPIWLSVTAGLSVASGESPAWAIAGFAITAAYLGFWTRVWLKRRRRIAKEPRGTGR